ncbi:NtaA/DmoA family FMN-dependent monooxygenase [Parasphingorhabdus sp.]|uniref:NtaA/DmoA family FMN-dependent monooxygenase n=1 Tax=Parasphingorhabdus sp. TaxID=2709688 RepID=UPI003262D200
MTKQIHLWAFLQGIGHYPSGWRHADAQPEDVFSMDYYKSVGQLAERGRFDSIVFGDQLQSRGANGHTPERVAIPTLDPIALLAAMGAVTDHIGLVATVSTTYFEPQAVAERFATLDRVTGGRAGWNIVTTAHPASAWNFGQDEMPEKSSRYARAHEFVDAACELWDSADADRKATPVQYRGKHIRMDAAMPGPVLPQGRPILVQAGQSPDGRAFAAATAEAIFCPAPTKEDGIAFRNDMHERIAAAGRDPEAVKIMPGLSFILADSEEEAIAKDEAILDLADEALCIEYLGESIGFWLGGHDPKEPIPFDDILAGTEFPVADITRMLEKPAASGIALGEFASNHVRTPRGHTVFRGTPQQLADRMIDWIDSGACDGFTLQPAYMPGELEIFVDQVVPLLQKAGRLRLEYPGPTLRDTMGIAA